MKTFKEDKPDWDWKFWRNLGYDGVYRVQVAVMSFIWGYG